MTPYPTQDAEAIRRGYEQYAPASVPPGMYFDRESCLVLPEGTRPARISQVIAAYLLAVLLFILTLGAGYLIWALVTWGQGQTPAQRLLGLRCWRPDTGRVAGRKHMAIRQVTGLLLNGELLAGVFILMIGESLNSVGDFFAGTTVLHDPDDVLLKRIPDPIGTSRP
jgi:uncharacterized RDD family membrane protein YckC